MANTFKALCELADWSVLTGTSPQETYTTPATSSTDDLCDFTRENRSRNTKPSKRIYTIIYRFICQRRQIWLSMMRYFKV